MGGDKVMRIGLTGGTGSGKSSVANILLQLGATLIDADKLGHEVLLPGGYAYDEVRTAFPEHVLEDGTIHRPSLGAHVFTDKDALLTLNSIVHPSIEMLLTRRLEESSGIVIVDAALLIESGLYKRCDEVWLVTAPIDMRIARVCKRDGLSPDLALSRINSQTDDNYKRMFAHREIINTSDFDALKDTVNILYSSIISEKSL